MFLDQLKLTNFKNYSEANLRFSAKINCFTGDNGAGKTNLLDAIYYLSFTKSFFNSLDMQNIRHNEDFFALHGTYFRNGTVPETLHCIQKRSQPKKFSHNKTEYDRLADHIGLFPLVMVSPYDRDLINEGSETRRKYIDGVISQFDRAYLDNLLTYNKALQQRNAMLKHFAEMRYFDYTSIQIYDEQLVATGITILQKRTEFLDRFMPLFQQYFEYITGGRERVDIQYETQLAAGNYVQLLENSLERDRASRYTNTGIHKDDLGFSIGGYPVKKYGSQGQQKSFVVAIKLAQYEYTRQIKGFKPIILLDDIFDKLDHSRVQKIIDLTSGDSFGQVFITDTQPERIETVFSDIQPVHKFFNVENGMVFG